MTLREFEEEYGYHISCKDCANYGINCTRLCNKERKVSFAKGCFMTQPEPPCWCVCSDFELNTIYKLLREKWQPEWKDELLEMYSKNTVKICLDHNWDIRYEIKADDFVNDTFFDDNGNLKWIRKQYYKQSRKNPIGYIFINEYPDGFIQENASTPILWEHVNNGDKREN